MNKNENKTPFEEMIKSKLENYSLPVDDDCWNAMEARLAAQSKSKRIALLPWISWAVAIAACIALCWILFPITEKTVLNKEVAEQLPVPEVIDPAPVEISEKNPAMTLPRRQKKQAKPTTLTDGLAVTEATTEQVEVATKTETKEHRAVEAAGVKQKENPDPTNVPSTRRVSKKTNTLGLHLSSGGGLVAMNNRENAPMYTDKSSAGERYTISKNAPQYIADGLFKTDDFSELTHHAPISLGISFKKDLNAMFALETGLVYTYLASKYENENPKRDAVLQLHYLGIPLNLQTKIHTAKTWELYLSVGTMVEKGLLSHYSQNEYYNNRINWVLNTTSNEKIQGLQWSLNASLGVDYKINKQYSIYFGPKVGYYLDNNQPISARTKNPLVVGVNLGVRYVW